MVWVVLLLSSCSSYRLPGYAAFHVSATNNTEHPVVMSMLWDDAGRRIYDGGAFPPSVGGNGGVSWDPSPIPNWVDVEWYHVDGRVFNDRVTVKEHLPWARSYDFIFSVTESGAQFSWVAYNRGSSGNDIDSCGGYLFETYLDKAQFTLNESRLRGRERDCFITYYLKHQWLGSERKLRVLNAESGEKGFDIEVVNDNEYTLELTELRDDAGASIYHQNRTVYPSFNGGLLGVGPRPLPQWLEAKWITADGQHHQDRVAMPSDLPADDYYTFYLTILDGELKLGWLSKTLRGNALWTSECGGHFFKGNLDKYLEAFKFLEASNNVEKHMCNDWFFYKYRWHYQLDPVGYRQLWRERHRQKVAAGESPVEVTAEISNWE